METVTVILFVLVTIFGTIAVVAAVFAMLAYYKHDDQETLTHASVHGHDPKEIVQISKGTYTATLPRKDVTGTSFTTTPGITVGSLTTPATTTGHVLNLTNPPNIIITTPNTSNPASTLPFSIPALGLTDIPMNTMSATTIDVVITMGKQSQHVTTTPAVFLTQPWIVPLPTSWRTDDVGLAAGAKNISISLQGVSQMDTGESLTIATDGKFNVSSTCSTKTTTLVEAGVAKCFTE